MKAAFICLALFALGITLAIHILFYSSSILLFQYYQCMLEEEQPRCLASVTEGELKKEPCMHQSYTWEACLAHIQKEHRIGLKPVIDYCR